MLDEPVMNADYVIEILIRLRSELESFGIGVYCDELRGLGNHPLGLYKQVRFYMPWVKGPGVAIGHFFDYTGGERVAKKLGENFGIEYHYSPSYRPDQDPDILIPASDGYSTECYRVEELEPAARKMIELKKLLDYLETENKVERKKITERELLARKLFEKKSDQKAAKEAGHIISDFKKLF